MARKGEQILREIATAPIMGWQRTTTFTKGRKNPKFVTETSSFTLRAWEVAAVGIAAVFFIHASVLASKIITEGSQAVPTSAYTFGLPAPGFDWLRDALGV